MTRYSMTYTLTPEMQYRAMMSWAKPTRSRAQKRKQQASGILVALLVLAALVGLLRYDIITNRMLFSALFGFYLAMGLWYFVTGKSTRKLTAFATEALLRQGPLRAEFSDQVVTLNTDISTSSMNWRCFDEVSEMEGATLLRAGVMIHTIPDRAMPDGTTPQEFRDDLRRWMEAGK